MNQDSLIREGMRMREGGVSIEEMLQFFRNNGASKVQSISMLAQVAGLSVSEAKSLVHTSSAWADVRDDHDRFLDDFEAAAEESLDSGQGDKEE